MLIKNQIYQATVVDYTAQGQGIAKIEGCAVFIPNAIVGEKCTVRIEKAQKTWAAGKIVELLEKSPHRVNRECPVAKLCGGCDFWHMDYEEEARLKADRVLQALNRIGGENLTELPILSAPTCYGYRNKAQYPVAAKKGRTYTGFYRAGTHSVVESGRCLILPEITDKVKDAVLDYVNQYRITVYDEQTGKGLLRHIFIRKGEVSGQILVCLAVNGRKLPHASDLIDRLKKIPGFATLVLSVNTKDTNIILGDEFITLYGPGYIEDTLCGLTFRLSPRSFYQVNHHQAQRLYQAAIELAGITKADTVLDLYCGVGTITLSMAAAAGKVIGVEVIPQAVADAKDNAKRNGIENAEFFCGDAGEAALALAKEGIRIDVAVVDPPRKGLNADAIEALAQIAPRRIVYVSCDPATLARDVALLKARGYVLKNAMAADLFPRCAHIESIVCLTRKEVCTHQMKLHAEPFAMIKSGEKTIELRLYDEKRQQIREGDLIVFTCTATGEKLTAKVQKLHRFASFEELYRSLPLLQCGYTAEDIDSASPADMESYYSKEEQQKYGVVGIELAL
ncbi:MAG: 23S rRNA (uracil(1939)-C(5))-methyltransferase RlmD [Oscillospiraceae bacterium]|nr:23S rRNA (uracil(1939)-C(5))-methyltransferase RlmD [Oscillospiraceae bacterium]